MRRTRTFGSVAAAVLLALVLAARPAWTVCNLIPGTMNTFRGTLGSTDRPFAGPGDFVELRLSPICDAAAFCPFTSRQGFCDRPDEHVVTVVFTPPQTGPRNIVVLTTDCITARVKDALATCEATTGITPVCQTVETDPQRGPVGLETVEREGKIRLRFRFPDTDGLLEPPDDDRTFTGPATLAVTARGEPLPCDLANVPCAGHGGLLACVDTLFAIDRTCGTAPDETFSHFTALPPPNDFQALCTDPVPPCTGATRELRFTVDTAGNILAPMDWRGVLVGQGVPVARLLHGSTSVEAFPGSGQPIQIPSNAFLRSLTPEGGPVAPIFDPQADPTALNEATFFGSADAPAGVLRIARRSPTFQTCAGGTNAGLPCMSASDCPPVGTTCGESTCSGGTNSGLVCTSDSDCSSGECGLGLFDFSTRLEAGIGPVVIPRFDPGVCQAGTNGGQICSDSAACPSSACVAYRSQANDPVPLDGLVETETMLASVVPEAITGEDLNGDGDATDDVLVLADRQTGVRQPIGTVAASGQQARGRAATRVRQPPFTFPAMAAERDVVAFLEPEPAQGNLDANGNGQVFESILRVFRLAGGSAVEVTSGQNLAIDAAPLVNRRSLALSGGLVFVRVAEAAGARLQTTLVSLNSRGKQGNGHSDVGAISANGQFVAFTSQATNLDPGDTDTVEGIFVRDRQAGTTELVSIASEPAHGTYTYSFDPAISADGGVVAFSSYANNLVAADTNGFPDVFVRDGEAETTERVSVASDGVEGNHFSFGDDISADGRFVAFSSYGSNLVAGDTNGGGNFGTDIFVHDRFTSTTERVSVSSDGTEANSASFDPAISADGRLVAFWSHASNLVAGDTNDVPDVFVHDRQSGMTTRVSVDSQGNEGNGQSTGRSAVSADGRFVAFESSATNLVAGDTSGDSDVFVRDRQGGTTERVSVSSSGSQENGFSEIASISADGRFVTFSSSSTNLVAGDSGGLPTVRSVFVHDRQTGTTARVSVDSTGTQANDGSFAPDISADGRFVAFSSAATNLVAGDTNNREDIFVRGVDPTDLAHDFFPDGQLDDTVLQVLTAATGDMLTLCPAEDVVVVGTSAAFLRPEAAGAAPGFATCPEGTVVTGGTDLNGDGDAADRIVQLWPGTGPVQNLGVAATAVSMSETYLAALVSEAAQGNINLNDDWDTGDTVVEVRAVSGGAWMNTHMAADTVEVCGSVVVFITPEAAQGKDLNDDGDQNDRVLQLFDPNANTVTNLHMAAEEFVCGPSLVAFRSPEAAQGEMGTDLNEDNDTEDYVLQVYDLVAGVLLNSKQAVTPCRLEACDPRIPYRVLNDTVRFLTLEVDQGHDLNGDDDMDDLVLQVLNVRQACQTANPMGACHTLAAAPAGICTDSGNACANDSGCSNGTCFVPPGGCIRDLETFCNPETPNACGAEQFCQPSLGVQGQGTCQQVEGPCRSQVDCSAPAVCHAGDASFNRLVSPLMEQNGSAVVFTGAGRCVEDFGTTCTVSADCPPGGFCVSGTCHREHGTCRTDEDCPAASLCEQDVLVATAPDTDGDEIPDPFDNCPRSPNVDQADCDGNGVGDACDAPPASCGNGQLDPCERCDDGNLVDGDGCDSNCTPTGCGNRIVTAGEQCDDGNTNNSDGCKSDCTLNVCGDGFVHMGVEQCDDGNPVDGDGCDSNCTRTRCGNDIVTVGEACDDGNTSDIDACKTDCTLNVCGDGFVHTAVEQCDDGNTNSSDACKTDCTDNVCGDGVIRTDVEQCDDGNLLNSDGCSSNCTQECSNPVAHRKLLIRRLDSPPGDDELMFMGVMTLPFPFNPALDPLANGVRVLLDDMAGNVLDVTVPPGAFAQSLGEGWKANKSGPRWIYRNNNPAPPGGIVRIVIRDRSSSAPGLVRFVARGRAGSYVVAPANLPVRALIVLSPSTGQCGEATFPGPVPIPSCAFNPSGSALKCR